MKIVRNLIFSFIFVLLLIFIYINFDTIKSTFYSLIVKENKITIPDSNEYQRKYKYLKFKYEEDYIPHSKEDIENIFFNILNNGWSEFVFYCPTEYEKCADDIETVSSDVSTMSKIAGYVSPYNSHQSINTAISSHGEIYVKVAKKYTDDEIEKINEEIKEIYDEYTLSEKSLNEKIKIFHDYLIKNTTYDEAFANGGNSVYDSTKANGALLEHYAVCGGYAEALALFLDYINVPNIIISNKNHAWNLVFYNGEWFHIDPTWNDAEIERFEYEFYMIKTPQLLEIDNTEHSFDIDFFIEAK